MAAPVVTNKCSHCDTFFKAKGTRTRQCSPECYILASIRIEGECHVWGKGKRHGYGIAMWARKEWQAHRLAYHTFRGPIPDGMLVCHMCDNPSCVRPSHLFLGTVLDNHLDAVKKGRTKLSQSENYAAKLTAEQVRQIKVDMRSIREIAEEFHVAASTIYGIRGGFSWKTTK